MFDFLRNWTKSAAAKQQEVITAYLDNALPPAERQRFEQQMTQDATLRAEVEQQRQTRQLLRQLPSRQVPRNFTLDPALYGRPARQPLVTYYPALRAATVLTAVFLFFIVGLNLFSFADEQMASAPDMALSQFAVEPANEEAVGVAADSATLSGDSQVEEPVLESAPPAEPALPAAVPTSVGEVTEEEAEEASAEEEASVEGAVEGAPAAAAEAPAEATAVPQATPSPAATMEAGIIATPLPTATVSDLPRMVATEVADRAELVATAVPVTSEADTDTANIAPTLEAVATAVTAPTTSPPASPVDFLSALVVALFLLLVLLIILTLYARRKQPW